MELCKRLIRQNLGSLGRGAAFVLVLSLCVPTVTANAFQHEKTSNVEPCGAEAGSFRSQNDKTHRSRSLKKRKKSSSERPPNPAEVVLKQGVLTVASDDSNLTQILTDISKASGMAIDGSISNVRVFGLYGPSNPRDVLTDLLKGLGYNFMMVGTTREGAPKELVLTQRNGAATPPSPSSATASQHEDPEMSPDEPGPGAVLHVPPPASDNQQDRMQQHLDRLQQMHQPPKPPGAPQ